MKQALLYLFFLLAGMARSFGMSLPAQEKVYLHFDQAGYFLKETMWFTAYVLNESNRPTDISKVLYVELLSPEGGAVATRKYKIEDGMCHGEFYLDSAYLSGFFEVRAYTRHMRNYGEDNYFSRVFPVFDIVFQGDYGFRRLYDRTRPDLLHEHKRLWIDELEDWKRLKEKAAVQQEPLPDSVLQAMQAVALHNRNFTASAIRCLTPPPDSLKPGERVELTFRTTPGSRFSLAVTDASSDIYTNYRGDIHRSLFLDSGWVARSYYATRSFDPQQDIFLSPEKGLAVDGEIYTRSSRRWIKRLEPGCPIRLSLPEDTLRMTGETMTSEKGYWAFYLKDFHGDRIAYLSTPYVVPDGREAIIKTYKWFSPVPRPYRDEETLLPENTYKATDEGTLQETSDDMKSLDEVEVKARRRRYTREYLKVSTVHFPLAEEIDYLTDLCPNCNVSTQEVGSSILTRYYYPDGGARWMVLDKYPGDHVPIVGEIREMSELLPPDIKEVVIRTDPETCRRYGFDKKEFVRKYWNGDMRGWQKQPWGDVESSDRKLCYVVCYVKYSPEELKSPARLRSYGLSPSNRITVVKGYTRPAVFPFPDYAQSRDGLQEDFRRTLYWNPEVRADENGRARVTFYNNSTCHTLHISAEGIGGDGKPVIYKQKID